MLGIQVLPADASSRLSGLQGAEQQQTNYISPRPRRGIVKSMERAGHSTLCEPRRPSRPSPRMRSSAHQARTFVVELPPGDQVLHCDRIVARSERLFPVQPVVFLKLHHVELDAQSRLLRNANLAHLDLGRIARQSL